MAKTKRWPYFRAVPPPTRLPYRVHSVGRMYDNPRHSTLGTYHDDVMVTLFLGGKGWYRWKGEELEVLPGMVGVVLPRRSVGVLMSDADDPYDHFWCRFAGREALATARRISKRYGGAPFFPYERWSEWADSFRLLESAWNAREPSVGEERTRPVDGLLAYLLSLLDEPPPAAEKNLTAERLRRYMHDRLAEAANLDLMAAHFNVSKPHLCRSAKSLLGNTLHHIWQEMKMEWARVLLRESRLSIAQVAQRVGFEDPFYFSKVFRAYAGKSPSEWRRTASSEIP